MKQLFIFLGLMICSFQAFAQDFAYNPVFSYVDSLKIRTRKIPKIAEKLTSRFSRDEDKALAIYRWIANTIRYDCKEYHRFKKGKINKKRQSVKKVLHRKKAICGGYANLYKAICDKSNLNCEIISGTSKTRKEDIGRYQPKDDHAWNAIKIDNQWRLLDVTWGSGYADEKVKKFTRAYNHNYFFTSPEKMIYNHYPRDSSWQLLDKIVSRKEFYDFPLSASGFYLFDYQVINPESGVLEVNEDEDVNFRFKTPFDFKTGLVLVENIYKKISRYGEKADYKYDHLDIKKSDGDWKFSHQFTKPGKYFVTIYLDRIPFLVYLIKVNKVNIPGRTNKQ